jgi:hypothetical protein
MSGGRSFRRNNDVFYIDLIFGLLFFLESIIC